jgi:hypothetical protein
MQPSKPNKDDNNEGLAALLSAVLAQTSIIQSTDNEIDSKANNLMAAALVIVALIGVQLKAPDGQWYQLSIVAMGVILLVIGLVIYLTRNQGYYETVVDLDQHNEYFNMENEELLAQLISDAAFANTQNAAIIERKQRLFKHTVLVFLLGFGLGVLALFIHA